jgi:hypothetical protein
MSDYEQTKTNQREFAFIASGLSGAERLVSTHDPQLRVDSLGVVSCRSVSRDSGL